MSKETKQSQSDILPDNLQEWVHLHDEACYQGNDTYIDPETGYMVFTKLYLLKRGYCCKSGCRHCPYEKED